jgi:recombination DNA repair RAD52 pathway protein
MAVSDQLTTLAEQVTRLAARAKETEDRTATVEATAKEDLEAERATARASAEKQAKKLRESTDAHKDELSAWWSDQQRSWNELVAKIRGDIETKRAEHDKDRAERRAAHAANDAVFAIEFAYGAVIEAEYAVLDAALARTEADDLATA